MVSSIWVRPFGYENGIFYWCGVVSLEFDGANAKKGHILLDEKYKEKLLIRLCRMLSILILVVFFFEILGYAVV